MGIEKEEVAIPATDGFLLTGAVYKPQDAGRNAVILMNAATAVPHRFYGRLATFLAEAGYTVITYDYRGIGDSRPASLRGFDLRARDWPEKDMAGVIDWAREQFTPHRLFAIGHSIGGQVMGLVPNGRHVDAMVTMSAQSGYWRLQGGYQKAAVAFHVHVTFPLLAHLFGYMPWSWFGSAQDLPKGVALDWARWCRHPRYLLGDLSLPLHRYADFTAPVLAYSFDDDDWGTARSVNAMMTAYPNLERRHVVPSEVGLQSIGHFGYFRSAARELWHEAVDWLARHE